METWKESINYPGTLEIQWNLSKDWIYLPMYFVFDNILYSGDVAKGGVFMYKQETSYILNVVTQDGIYHIVILND